MGDYTFMRGSAKIKPELVPCLEKFFFNLEDGSEVANNWNYCDLPNHLKATRAYELLCLNNIGHWIPSGLSNPAQCPWGDKGYVSLLPDGTFSFLCGFKNYHSQQEAFLLLLVEMAEEYVVEQDWTDCMMFRNYEPGEGITLYTKGEQDEWYPRLLDRVERAIDKVKREENKRRDPEHVKKILDTENNPESLVDICKKWTAEFKTEANRPDSEKDRRILIVDSVHEGFVCPPVPEPKFFQKARSSKAEISVNIDSVNHDLNEWVWGKPVRGTGSCGPKPLNQIKKKKRKEQKASRRTNRK